MDIGQIHETLTARNFPFSKIHCFDADPLRPFLRLYNFFAHVKGVLKTFTFKNFTSGGCSEDEKVEKFAVDGRDVEVIVRWIKMKDIGE